MNEDVLARRVGGAIELRARPMALAIALDPPMAARDGATVNGTVTLEVSPGPSPADRQLIADELLPDRPFVTHGALVARFGPAVREAAGRVIGALDAPAVVAPTGCDAIADATRRAADRIAFSLGLIIAGAVRVELRCPALEQAKRHARRLAEIDRAAEIAARFASLRQANPDVSPASLLERLHPGERDAIAAGVLAADVAAATVWVVAGSTLLWAVIPTDGPPATGMRLALDQFGPLRCIRRIGAAGGARLAIGARGGVMLLDPDDPGQMQAFASASLSQRGFNAVGIDGARLLATHGEIGLVAWSLQEGIELRRWTVDSAVDVVASPAGVIVATRRALLHPRGDALHELATCDADVIALAGDGAATHALLADGQVLSVSPSAPTRRTARRAEVTAAAGWDSPIGYRIVRATGAAGVEAFGLDDSIVTHFLSPHAGLRMVAAGDGLVAGVSADRQRLIVWRASEPRQPAGEINITAVTGHRVAGICI